MIELPEHMDEEDGPFEFRGMREDIARLREVCLHTNTDGQLVGWTDDEIAQRVRAHGVPMTRGYFQQLCDGSASNPSATKLLGVAKAFGVPPSYFFSDTVRRRVNRRLDARLEGLRKRVLFGEGDESD